MSPDLAEQRNRAVGDDQPPVQAARFGQRFATRPLEVFPRRLRVGVDDLPLEGQHPRKGEAR